MSDSWQEHRRRMEQAAGQAAAASERAAAASADVARSARKSAASNARTAEASEWSAASNARTAEANERRAYYSQITAAAALGTYGETRRTRWAVEEGVKYQKEQAFYAKAGYEADRRDAAETRKLQQEWRCPNCGRVNGTSTILSKCKCGQDALEAIFFHDLERKNGELCSKCNTVKLKGSDCFECSDRQRFLEELGREASRKELDRLKSESETRFAAFAEQAKSEYERQAAQMDAGYTHTSHQLQASMATTGKISSLRDIKQFFNLLRVPIIAGIASWAVIALLSALTSGGGGIAWLLLLICGIGPALTRLKIPATWKQVGIATVIELIVLIVFISIFAGSNIVVQVIVFPLSLLVAGVTGPLAVLLLNADAINRRHAHFASNLNQLNQEHAANMQQKYNQHMQAVTSTENTEKRNLSREVTKRQKELEHFKNVVLPSRIRHDKVLCDCTTQGYVSQACG